MKNNSKLRNTFYNEVTRLYYQEGCSEERIAGLLQIGHTTVNRWVSDYARTHGKSRKSLRVEMGGKVNEEAVSLNTEKEKLLRQLTRKLSRARHQVALLEEMIATLTREDPTA